MLTEADIKNVSLEKSPESVNFCAVWPSAKAGLQVLAGIIKNPVVKGVIGMIVTLGDSLCPSN